MRQLLRNVIAFRDSDSQEILFRNFQNLTESGLGFDTASDNLIWGFVKDVVRDHSHVPDFAMVRDFFAHREEDEVIDRLSVLSSLPSLSQAAFMQRLHIKADERRTRLWTEKLREAGVILTQGMKLQDGREERLLKGAVDSANFLRDAMPSIVAPTIGAKLTGDATSEAELRDFWEEYERVEADPLSGVGQYTGLEQIDTAWPGAKRHELWIHAAFTGGMKSTFMLNWAYNQAVHYVHDSVVFSLEMPYQQVRRMLVAMHSSHFKFRRIRTELGLQPQLEMDIGLDYTRIRDGQLNSIEKKFLRMVVEDLGNPAKGFGVYHDDEVSAQRGHGKIHIEVADPDKSDFTVADLRMRAEVIYSKSPFATIYVDHVGLMSPRKWVPSTTERLNEIIRDLKRLAMAFHRGQGIAVVALFQINREGFKRVTKAKEMDRPPLYNLTDLSYANEAERSADKVTATWVDDDLRDQNLCMFQCLKSRDDALFKPFFARVEWPCRRLLTTYEEAMDSATSERVAEDLDSFVIDML